ncbi:LLM class flavin-dependent oxidoreductase [Mycolicibacterium sediminis]|uniref:Luciferase-like domain-containing protein n=1 Tax=Mycolicibacterium sediminis TaxID=1286180 RepID=A0A7I7QNA5_9MYCO|nr:LLM class flavin-dependent oxidoreductase [Mycolicibacterium sediminis]BBY27772.1 hypothetical protein MSEDJ_18680 [Mycolicibacterium sediminis]
MSVAVRVTPSTRVADLSGVDYLVGDAMTLAALAGVTDRVGLMIEVDVATAAPFTVARRLATLDHLSAGRAGVLLHGGPHGRAEEFAAVVEALWSGWVHGTAPSTIRRIDHRGPHFEVSGMPTLPAGPRERPAVVFDEERLGL